MINSEITDNQNITESKSPNWDLPEHCGILTEQVLFELGWMKDYAKFKVISSNIYMDLVENGVFELRDYVGYPWLAILRLYPDISFMQSICWDAASNNDYDSSLLANCSFNNYPFSGASESDILGSKGFHFDNLFTYYMIENRWNEIDSLVKEEGRKMDGNIDNWLSLIGVILHAVQDFYCHSNWTILTSYYGYDNKVSRFSSLTIDKLPTWEEINDSIWQATNLNFNINNVNTNLRNSNFGVPSNQELNESDIIVTSGLQTGNCNVVNHECKQFSYPVDSNNFPWNHRHPGTRTNEEKEALHNIYGNKNASYFEFREALLLSKRASKYWVNYLSSTKILSINDSIKFRNYVLESKDNINSKREKYYLSNKKNYLSNLLSHNYYYKSASKRKNIFRLLFQLPKF